MFRRSSRPPAPNGRVPSRDGGLKRQIILALLTYALGLIPFYLLTPVHDSVPSLFHPPPPTPTVAPVSVAAPTAGRSLALATVVTGPPHVQPNLAVPTDVVSQAQPGGDASSVVARPSPSNPPASVTPPAASVGWLLYGLNGDLWETNGDQTSQLTRVGRLSQPVVAADFLVYVERGKDHSDLWLAQPRVQPRQITHNASADVTANHWVTQPAILPGGRRIYVLSDHNKEATGVGDLAIWSLDLPNGSPRQITHPPAYTGGDQDVALDPREPGTMVFTRYSYVDNGQLIEGLVWLAADSEQTIPLTAPDHPARQASFAPDGAALAFVQRDGQADNLYVARIDATQQPRLVNVQQAATGTITEPVWSPTGTELAYIALTDRQFQLWVRPVGRGADGTFVLGQPQQITHGDGIDAASRPVWLTGTLSTDVPSWLTAVH